MRTLIITSQSPFPAMSGGALRCWQIVNTLQPISQVGVFHIALSGTPSTTTAQRPENLAFYQMAIVETHGYTKRSQRWKHLLHCVLHQSDLYADSHYTPAIAQQLTAALKTYQPDYVIFEELWVYRYLPIVQQHGCKVIYDAFNVESTLQADIFHQQSPKRRLRDRINDQLRLHLLAQSERYFTQQVDQVWACSHSDAQQLQQIRGSHPTVACIPNAVNSHDYRSIARDRQLQSSPRAKILIFTASFSYAPNVTAAHWLIDEIFPQVQALHPDSQLFLVGASPSPSMEAAAMHNSNIHIPGRVPDMRPYLAQSTIAIVPLKQGGGTRLKILEAFASRLPVISTTKGAEGINAEPNRHLMLGDTTAELVAAIDQLWRSPTIADAIADAAYDLVEQDYSWGAITQRLAQLIQPSGRSAQMASSAIG
jgi:polysaccharide biosynthesis protein PslH